MFILTVCAYPVIMYLLYKAGRVQFFAPKHNAKIRKSTKFLILTDSFSQTVSQITLLIASRLGFLPQQLYLSFHLPLFLKL